MKLNRLKILEVHADIISDIAKRAVGDKIPKDSKVLRVSYSASQHIFQIVIYSKEFPVVPDGSMLERLRPPIITKDILK